MGISRRHTLLWLTSTHQAQTCVQNRVAPPLRPRPEEPPQPRGHQEFPLRCAVLLLEDAMSTIFNKRQKSDINFFYINFLDPTQNPPLWTPRKKSLYASFPGKECKRDPYKLFRGDFWGQKWSPKWAIFGHKKFSLLFFFSGPYTRKSIAVIWNAIPVDS